MIANKRVQSIDFLRGIIMLIMALDHVREHFHFGALSYSATNLKTTYPELFFTRWITHFCAPNFVFLSGISVYLASRRKPGSFFVKRGAWLILVEIVLISFALTLNPLYNVIILQVIWAIGVSMILLGLLIKLPPRIIGMIGLVLIAGHDLLPATQNMFMQMFFTARATIIHIDSTHFIFDLYAVLPWTGVMFLGFWFGTWYEKEAVPRKQFLMYSGIAGIMLFIALRLYNGYGDPAHWEMQKNALFTLMSFLNASKYPPSLIYCLMTISPALIVLAFTENMKMSVIKVYGSVPFFYYILHFYLIRVLTILVFFAQGFKTDQIVTPNSPWLFLPPGIGFSLGTAYLIWLGIVIALYFPCRWFSNYRRTHHQWWLSYL
jgi:uncharacterized membrane protein